jgi:hypothetical protein
MEGLRIEIDDPDDRRIVKPAGVIRGWFAGCGIEMPEAFDFRIDGVLLPSRTVTREDVEEAMPDHTIVAFDIPYDLVNYLPYIEDRRLVIHLKIADYDPVLLRFYIKEEALASCLADAGGV